MCTADLYTSNSHNTHLTPLGNTRINAQHSQLTTGSCAVTQYWRWWSALHDTCLGPTGSTQQKL